MFEKLEGRLLISASPYNTAVFTALPSKPDVLATATSNGGTGGTDLNGDGRADLVVRYNVEVTENTPASSTLAAMLGQADGTFITNTIVTYTSPDVIDETDVRDFSGDGRPDVVVLHAPDPFSASPVIDVYLANANGTYTKTNQSFEISTAFSSLSLNVFDMNGDSHDDLVLIDFSAQSLIVLRGNGNGTFLSPVTTAFAQQPTAYMEDLNGDNVTDVVASGFDVSNGQTLSVFTGNADGSYDQTPTFSDSENNYTFSSLEQLNSDTRLDLIVYTTDFLHPDTPTVVTVLTNNGSANFAPSWSQSFDHGVFGGITATQDLDNDGDNDIVINEGTYNSGTPFVAHIEKNNGSAVFTDIQQITLEGDTPSIFPFDVDHDGFVDGVSLTNLPSSKATVYFNNHNATFIDPGVVIASTPVASNFGLPSLLNNDLKYDWIFTRAFGNGAGNNPVYAFVNTTGRAFPTQKTTELGANTLPDSLVFDVTGDSNADLIVFQGVPTGEDTATGYKIYTGVGDGSFAEATPAVSFGSGGIVDTDADIITFDNNASYDLYFTGSEPAGIYVSINSATTGGTPPDNAGNTQQTARDIGVLSSEQTFTDAVNPSDTDDYYKFTATTSGTVHLTLTGLSANADIKLIDSTGPIANGSLGGAANESITHAVEAGTTYYIRVFNVGGVSTNYTLKASVAVAGAVISVKQGTATITSGQASAVDLGAAVVGAATQPQVEFTIKNTGSAALTLGSLVLPTGFSVIGNSLPQSLAANQSATIKIGLPTGTLGIYTGNITLPNNSEGTQNDFTIPVVGRIEFPINNLHDFGAGATNGSFPIGDLTPIGSTLYGATAGGGANNKGMIYSTNTSGATPFILHSFAGGADDGAGPNSPLTNSFVNSQFVLFGETSAGGSADKGTLYRINAAGGGYQVIHEFGSVADDGAIPFDSVVVFAGKVYGITSNGGTNSNGIIYSVNVDGTGYTVLHRFAGGTDDGRLPSGGLIQVGTTLYGVTQFGGANSSGTLYSINLDGSGYTVLRSFAGPASTEAQPRGTLLQLEEKLYGVTLGGTLYSVNLDGTGFTALHTFTGNPGDGLNPTGGLLAVDSTIYGLTQSGGPPNFGTLYRIDADGQNYVVLHSFAGGADGRQPSGRLSRFQTTLFNATTFGGASNQGELYSISTLPPASQQPDLAGSITALTLNGKTPDPSEVFIPGDKLGINMTVSNIGTVIAPAGATGVNFYLSADQTLDTNSDFLVQSTSFARAALDPLGDEVAPKFSIQLPLNTPQGSFYLIADIDSAHVLAEANEDNNAAVSSFIMPIAFAAGDVGTRANVSLTIPDAEGRLVTLKLAGGGTVQATPGTEEGVSFFDLSITNVNANSSITITTKKTGANDDGITTLRNVTIGNNSANLSAFSFRAVAAAAVAPAGLGKFVAKAARLIGDLNAPQGLKALTLASVEGATIHIGASADPKASITLDLNLIQDLSIDSDMPIKSLTAIDWQNTDATADKLTAPTIGGITIKGSKPFALAGDFEADVTVEGVVNAAATAVALGAVKIAGSLTGSAWDVTGNAAGVTVGLNTAAFSLTTHGGFVKTTKLNTVDAATFNIDGDAGAITTTNWLAGALTAKSVKSIAVKGSKTTAGDMLANLTLLGDPANTKLKAPLGTLTVANLLKNSNIRVAGNSGAITVGGMENSSIFVGVKSTVVGSPAAAGDFDAFTLAGLTVKGIKNAANSFINSLVAAQTITKASVKDVLTTNNATPLGLIADKLGSYTRMSGALSVKLSKLDDPAALPVPGKADAQDDYAVLIV